MIRSIGHVLLGSVFTAAVALSACNDGSSNSVPKAQERADKAEVQAVKGDVKAAVAQDKADEKAKQIGETAAAGQTTMNAAQNLAAERNASIRASMARINQYDAWITSAQNNKAAKISNDVMATMQQARADLANAVEAAKQTADENWSAVKANLDAATKKADDAYANAQKSLNPM